MVFTSDAGTFFVSETTRTLFVRSLEGKLCPKQRECSLRASKNTLRSCEFGLRSYSSPNYRSLVIGGGGRGLLPAHSVHHLWWAFLSTHALTTTANHPILGGSSKDGL